METEWPSSRSPESSSSPAAGARGVGPPPAPRYARCDSAQARRRARPDAPPPPPSSTSRRRRRPRTPAARAGGSCARSVGRTGRCSPARSRPSVLRGPAQPPRATPSTARKEGPAGASPPLRRRGHGHRQTSVLSGGSLSKVSWPARGLPHGAGGSVGWDGGSSLRHQPRHPTKRCQSLPPPCRSHAAPNDRRHYASPCSCLLHSLPPALAPGPSFPYTPTSPGTTRTLGSPICGAST